MATTPQSELDGLQEQLNSLTSKRDKLAAKIALLDNHPLWQLAEEHHAATCHHNHADACDWYYHEWGSGNLGYAKGVSLRVVATIDRLLSETADGLRLDEKGYDLMRRIFQALRN